MKMERHKNRKKSNKKKMSKDTKKVKNKLGYPKKSEKSEKHLEHSQSLEDLILPLNDQNKRFGELENYGKPKMDSVKEPGNCQQTNFLLNQGHKKVKSKNIQNVHIHHKRPEKITGECQGKIQEPGNCQQPNFLLNPDHKKINSNDIKNVQIHHMDQEKIMGESKGT